VTAKQDPPRDDGLILEARAELDVPGETGRQARIFVIWLACLALAVILGSSVGAHIPMNATGTRAAEELARSRADKAKVAVSAGLLLPILLTLALNYRYRRGGGHARGITVDVTTDKELRVWGRGYGTRLYLPGAQVTERLVDVYAGRLGAWRQRRLRVRGGLRAPGGSAGAGGAGGANEIELATTAMTRDMDGSLRVEGGEGDCVELAREDYERIRACVIDASTSPSS
jgi:hypothetical protein